MSRADSSLVHRKCVPCEGGVPPLTPRQISKYLAELACPWQVIENKKLRFTFAFKDFNEAMFFANEVAAVADSENHHPDIHIYFKTVVIELYTHAIGGLSENDFILASKIEYCTP